MRKVIIGGTFDNDNGKSSHIVNSLSESLGTEWECVNGGSVDYIKTFDPTGIDVLIWMPNVSNDEGKVIDRLKTKNQRMILIQSKRVIEQEYTPSDVIGRLLKSHSLLGIMITKDNSKYRFRLFDPLGNQWADTDDIRTIGETINHRLDYLLGLSRINSKNVEMVEDYKVPVEFLDIVKKYGSEFTKYVNAINPNRLLGNASTRCAKGFPAIRMNDHILVTKRNVDKQTLSEDDFVLVEDNIDVTVKYKGSNKPSVDTPIQVKLFEHFDNIKYIIHGHAYVKDGIFTVNKIPCGYVEEYEEIKELIGDKNAANFKINLRGHGCIILADNMKYLEDQIGQLYSRPFPEE